MGIVAEDAVNQFEALMKQGQLPRSFSLVFFLSLIFLHKLLTLVSLLAVDEPLKKTFQVLFFLHFSDLFFYMGQFLVFLSMIIYNIFYIMYCLTFGF